MTPGIDSFEKVLVCLVMSMISSIFQASKLYSKILKRDVTPPLRKRINNVDIPPIILGDSAFPHHAWLQKPYGNANHTQKQCYFNYRLSRGCMVTECAYGQLKGRWRVLHHKSECNVTSLKEYVLACIVLHNICIQSGDSVCKRLDLCYDPVLQQIRPTC